MAYRANLFAATVCNTVRPMLWTVVLSCLPVRPVCVVGVLRQNGYRWIKMPLSRDRCRSRPKRHCVIHGDPAPPPDAHNPAIFGPCLLWPKGWMGQDATWYGDRHRSMPHCVRWDPAPPRKGAQQPPTFGSRLLWSNGCPSQQLLNSWAG